MVPRSARPTHNDHVRISFSSSLSGHLPSDASLPNLPAVPLAASAPRPGLALLAPPLQQLIDTAVLPALMQRDRFVSEIESRDWEYKLLLEKGQLLVGTEAQHNALRASVVGMELWNRSGTTTYFRSAVNDGELQARLSAENLRYLGSLDARAEAEGIELLRVPKLKERRGHEPSIGFLYAAISAELDPSHPTVMSVTYGQDGRPQERYFFLVHPPAQDGLFPPVIEARAALLEVYNFLHHYFSNPSFNVVANPLRAICALGARCGLSNLQVDANDRYAFLFAPEERVGEQGEPLALIAEMKGPREFELNWWHHLPEQDRPPRVLLEPRR